MSLISKSNESQKGQATLLETVKKSWHEAPKWQKVAFVVTAVFIGMLIAGLLIASPIGLGLLTGAVALSIGIYAGATLLTLSAAAGSYALKDLYKTHKKTNQTSIVYPQQDVGPSSTTNDQKPNKRVKFQENSNGTPLFHKRTGHPSQPPNTDDTSDTNFLIFNIEP